MNNNVGIFVPSCSCGRLFLFGHSYGTLCRAVGTRGQKDQVGKVGALHFGNFVTATGAKSIISSNCVFNLSLMDSLGYLKLNSYI